MRTDDDRGDDGPGGAGRVEMDGEHHVQLGLLYALREAVNTARGDAVGDILDRLTEYSKMHFASEQLLMRLYQYDDYDRHALDHEAMIQVLDDLRAEHAAGRADAVVNAMEVLDAGLVEHIRGADRALGHYLAALPRNPGRSP